MIHSATAFSSAQDSIYAVTILSCFSGFPQRLENLEILENENGYEKVIEKLEKSQAILWLVI